MCSLWHPSGGYDMPARQQAAVCSNVSFARMRLSVPITIAMEIVISSKVILPPTARNILLPQFDTHLNLFMNVCGHGIKWNLEI